MVAKNPIAFLSYVRSDDDHDAGRITELRVRLEGEVKIQTGQEFPIFQDRNDIKWGQLWKERIETTLLDSSFLIPVITPSYFRSEMCRKEFETFLVRERAIGENQLILPIYYVSAEELEKDFPQGKDQIADILRTRNWADWRGFRFEPLSTPGLRAEVATLAATIVANKKKMENVFHAADLKFSEKVPLQALTADSDTVATLRKFTPVVKVVRGRSFNPDAIKSISEDSSYYAYTDKYDEEIRPITLAEPDDILKFQKTLTNKMQKQKRDNDKKIKEFASFAKQSNVQSMIVLIDNSGSMRGEKIELTAAWTAIIAEALSQTNVNYEILGFTTRAWKGGQSRELWLKDGKPKNPGRLNDLRYLIYKDMSESFQEALPNFGIMLREGLLKENIDGEALLWATNRINKSPYKNKLIYVVSDGVPVDDSTLLTNTPTILEKHLMQTTHWIRNKTNVHLYSAGIEHDVSRYYGEQSDTIELNSFGSDFIDSLRRAMSQANPN